MSGRRTFYVETLGCPKNQVDSDKLVGTFLADGLARAESAEEADLVVVNTCAFIEEARQESIDVVLALAERKHSDAELVVTGCMAERYGEELATALPEADVVAGFGVPVSLGRKPGAAPLPSFDLLNLPRPASAVPWAYVKVAEGCDKACGFCAIPSFRGPQRSRTSDQILTEVDELVAGGAREIVLVAQDLASYGRDQGKGTKDLVPLIESVAARVERVRLLYLYPSDLTGRLIDAIVATGVPYFDLSLQHVSAPLVRRMRRWATAPSSSSASRPSAQSRPRRPSDPTSSSAIRVRPRTTTISSSPSSRKPSSTGAGSSPTPARSAPTPPTSMAPCPAR